MALRDGASSVQGVMARITRLDVAGAIDPAYPILTTRGFISASFSSEFEDGEEITEKNAAGEICITWKGDDSLTRIAFNLSLCSPDPEAAALLAGGKVIIACEDDADPTVDVNVGDVIGYSSPPVGAAIGNPVAVEIWSIANVGGKPAAGYPYWHWVFPYVKVRYDGDREFTNGALANEFTGQGLGNTALVNDGLNPDNPGDDFVAYKDALANPFSYVRTKDLPNPGWSGTITTDATNSITCEEAPGFEAATGATAGIPGTWTPSGSAAPLSVADLIAGDPETVVATPSTAWTTGQYVQTQTAGTGGRAHWNGTAWVTGAAP